MIYWKYIIAAMIILLIIIASLIFMVTSYDQKSDPASEKKIRRVVAVVLHKDPNHLSNEDFLKVTALQLSYTTLADIRFLEKFKNLEELDLGYIHFPISKMPKSKWKSFLAKLSIYTFSETHEYDLSPLKKLSRLEILSLTQTPVINIEPLANLTNLKVLKINGTDVADIEPLKGLHNLQELHIWGIKNKQVSALYEHNSAIQANVIIYDKFSDEQLEDLKKALPNLKIINAGWTFLQ